MRALGVSCNPRTAYLTLAVDAAITKAVVERVEVAAQYEASAELLSTLEEIRRAFGQLSPDVVRLLLPEHGGRKRSYQEIAPRVTLETLIRIAAVQGSHDIEVLSRPTLRARLGISKSGELSSHVGEVIAESVGRYWSSGRDLAGLAALAAPHGSSN